MPRLTLTYGLRWDVNPAPTSPNDHPGFVLTLLAAPVSSISVPPAGISPAYPTRYPNVAPRIGVAYQLSRNPQWGQLGIANAMLGNALSGPSFSPLYQDRVAAVGAVFVEADPVD